MATLPPILEYPETPLTEDRSHRAQRSIWLGSGLGDYAQGRPVLWQQRWSVVQRKLLASQLSFRVVGPTDKQQEHHELFDLLADLYRLRFWLAHSGPRDEVDAALALLNRDSHDWNADGSIRWIIAFDGDTPMAVEVVRQAGLRWECHYAGFDFGVQESDPVFSSLAMVLLAAESACSRHLIMCDESREIDECDWGFVRTHPLGCEPCH